MISLVHVMAFLVFCSFLARLDRSNPETVLIPTLTAAFPIALPPIHLVTREITRFFALIPYLTPSAFAFLFFATRFVAFLVSSVRVVSLPLAGHIDTRPLFVVVFALRLVFATLIKAFVAKPVLFTRHIFLGA